MLNVNPMRLEQVEWDGSILSRRVKMLYDSFPSSLLANVATAGLMTLVQWNVVSHGLLCAWWGALLVVLLVRTALYVEYKRNYLKLGKTQMLGAFRALVFVTGAVWGAVGVWFFTPENIPHQFVVAFLLAGLTSAAITTLSIDKLSAMLFVAPCLLPITINLIFENAQLGYAMAAMVVFFVIYAYVCTVRLERDIHHSIHVQSILESQKRALSNQKVRDEIIAKTQGDFIEKIPPPIFLREMLESVVRLSNSSTGFLAYKKHTAASFETGDEASDLNLVTCPDGYAANRADFGFSGEITSAKDDQYQLRLPVYLATHLVAVIGFNREKVAYTEEDAAFLNPILLMLRQIFDAIFSHQKHETIRHEYIRLSQVASQITNGVVVTDTEGEIVWVNSGFEKLTEYREAEVIGRKPGDFLQGADTDPAVIATMRQALALRQNFNVDLVNYTKRGAAYWVNIICNPLLGEDGALVGFMAIETDIDKQKKAQQELSYAYRLMEQSNAVALIGTWRVNLEVMTLEWSAVTKTIHEVSDDYCPSVEKALSFYKEGEHRDRINEVFGLAVSDGISFDEELLIVTALGHEKWVRAIGIPEVYNGKCHAIYGTFQDISEGKRIERVKNEFISTVSHELRTPLTSISGALGLMRSGSLGSFSKNAEQLLEIAHKNSLRLSHLINDLLDVEKLAAGKMEFNMKLLDANTAIVQSLVSIASYADQYKVTLSATPHEGSCFIFVDENRFQQILSNFISNAIKFSLPGGEVTVAAKVISNVVRVSVADTGVGISEEFKTQIFRKFSQEDSSDSRKKGGTGLGLAIARELSEKMNGKVDFYSELGQGSTFYCEFPLVKG